MDKITASASINLLRWTMPVTGMPCTNPKVKVRQQASPDHAMSAAGYYVVVCGRRGAKGMDVEEA